MINDFDLKSGGESDRKAYSCFYKIVPVVKLASAIEVHSNCKCYD